MLKVSAEQGKVKPVARGEQAAWEWLRGGGGQSFAELPGRSQKTFSESPRLLLLRDAGIRLESKAASG